MKKILLYLILGVLLVFTFFACSKSRNVMNNSSNNPNKTIVNLNSNTRSEEVTLYFANKEYVMTGNENIDKVIPEKRIIKYGKISKEEAILKELQKGPTISNASTEIPAKCKINSVRVVDGIAYVDFSSENLNGGSLQESLMIMQIVKTFTGLGNIDKVQFLVDGKKVETLMGHADISEPISIEK